MTDQTQVMDEVLGALGEVEVINRPEPLIFHSMGQVEPRVRYLCSVHFMTLRKEMPHQGMRTYTIPAQKRGEYFVLPVYDTQQFIQTITADAGAQAEIGFQPMPIAVEGVVRDLIASWATGFLGKAANYRPGIAEIKGPKPTQQELASLVRAEEDFADALILEGDEFIVRRNGKIQLIHREACNWRGQKREWNIQIRTGQTHKTGAATGEVIPMRAMVDGGLDLIEFYQRHGFDTQMIREQFGDTFIADILEQRAAKAAITPSKGVPTTK